MTIFVKPVRGVLDGKGCVWEFLLAEKGFNDLADDDKAGRVVACHTNGTFDVHFDALDYTAMAIFPDELVLLRPNVEANRRGTD